MNYNRCHPIKGSLYASPPFAFPLSCCFDIGDRAFGMVSQFRSDQSAPPHFRFKISTATVASHGVEDSTRVGPGIRLCIYSHQPLHSTGTGFSGEPRLGCHPGDYQNCCLDQPIKDLCEEPPSQIDKDQNIETGPRG